MEEFYPFLYRLVSSLSQITRGRRKEKKDRTDLKYISTIDQLVGCN